MASGTGWRTRMGRGSVRIVLSALTAALVATPFGVAWYLHELGLQVTEQFSTPVASLTPDEAALAGVVRSELPSRTPPVVLAYHDVRPVEEHSDADAEPRHHFVVTPEAFDAQLAALRAAGYSSITSDQYVDYLAGGVVPERSVLITFDDGTHGLWTHADKILERHGMHAASFLITGNVGANRPYYLSWQEIERMARSGRWDFQSHTRKMHARLPVDAAGTLASEMTHRRWLPDKNRLETLEEFETKIRKDLQASVQDILDHGLPRPTLFAFPFSEGFNDHGDSTDPQAAAVAMTVIREFFAGAFNNAPPQPLPAGSRAAAVGMTGRIELTFDSTVDELLAAVRARTPVTPAQAPPSRRPDLWTQLSDDTPAPVLARGDDVRMRGPGRWSGVAYGREATADWASYTASVTMRGLSAPGVENAALIARVGTREELSTQVSSDYLRVSIGLGAKPKVVRQLPLARRDQHTVTMTVAPTVIEIVVDGSVRVTVPVDGGPQAYGGIGLSSSRMTESAPWPVFTKLSVTAGRDLPNVKAGVGLPVRG
ncbi:polysaccharide deacetylase family protein [Mycolicibacterium baixiangningiae]|uniref:polysaccharide deacetylase family protein n=1 Tax=Mycolicibacterium baixiangningiae TaxID=2761578 RepID=UPI0018D18837|nr:polysaccharide deacetylase family protein [Mycolicibacterium baixiangningiae]